jgi:glucan phosphoethanolaminetransferase (alkaline phosphatase superfamily)
MTHDSKTIFDHATAALKIVGVIILFVTTPRILIHRIYLVIPEMAHHGAYKSAMLQFAPTLAATLSTGILPFIRFDAIRIPLAILFVVSYVIEATYFAVTDQVLNIAMAHAFWLLHGTVFDSFSLYLPLLVRSSWWLFPVAFIFVLRPPARYSVSAWFALVPACAFGLVAAAMLYSQGHLQNFPAAIGMPVKFAIAYAIPDPAESSARVKVNYPGDIKAIADHVVFIIDESVRGDVLGFNGATPDNTPFLSGHQDQFINFGVAVAGANCSIVSRPLLRFGVRPNDVDTLLSKGYTRPSIWSYAHRAGYRTVLIDPFRDKATYLNGGEWSAIDDYIDLSGPPSAQRDAIVVDKVLELLKDGRPSFIYVNKFGVHFPYDVDYPSDFDPFPKMADEAHPNARIEMRRIYNNAISWSVDRFFQTLLSSSDLSNRLVIYTSDHGDSLLDGGQKNLHCSQLKAQAGEGLVPMLAATTIEPLAKTLRASAARAPNKATHFDVFPTLLMAMGFDRQWVEQFYGPSLLELPVDRHRQFLLFGGKNIGGLFDHPTWQSVD